MTTGEKVTRLAQIKRTTVKNGNRISKLVTKQNELLAEGQKLFNSIPISDRQLFNERLTKYGYL